MRCGYYEYIDDFNGAVCKYDGHSLRSGKCENCPLSDEQKEIDADFDAFRRSYEKSYSDYNDD